MAPRSPGRGAEEGKRNRPAASGAAEGEKASKVGREARRAERAEKEGRMCEGWCRVRVARREVREVSRKWWEEGVE